VLYHVFLSSPEDVATSSKRWLASSIDDMLQRVLKQNHWVRGTRCSGGKAPTCMCRVEHVDGRWRAGVVAHAHGERSDQATSRRAFASCWVQLSAPLSAKLMALRRTRLRRASRHLFTATCMP